MTEPLKLMAILAHPDDESLGTGGILAKYAAEGVETFLVTATRGERGWPGDPQSDPGLTALGQLRQAELLAAAKVLGLRQVEFLDYIDGDLDQADPGEVIAKIVRQVRRVRPQVVVTFGPEGAYGHPDHIAICQFTTAALVTAADAAYDPANSDLPHRVSKLYYLADSKELVSLVQATIGDIAMTIDGVERRLVGWEEWAITTRIDATAHWRTVWQAITCHHTQWDDYVHLLEDLSAEQHQRLWGAQCFYRAFSLVNGGRSVENDLFAGLR
jgi:LmbE family N-acetylglucosaminyl deacetylase